MTTEFETFKRFVVESKFGERGAFFTDLDGTALSEDRGRISIPGEIKHAVGAVHELGRPVVINTLRFPLSVMRTIGLDWFEITHAPIPTVLLNGAVLGNIHRNSLGILVYEELAAHPLESPEVERIVDGIRELQDAGVTDVAVFYYPRDWIRGEMIWTPHSNEIRKLQSKYVSSTRVVSFPLDELAEEIVRWDSCMVFVLVNEERDKLMAYQHSSPSMFFSHAGVTKATGTEELSRILDISLTDSFGAGDTVMDTFLSELGMSISVGAESLPYKGKFGRISVRTPFELGLLISSVFGQKQGFLTKV